MASRYTSGKVAIPKLDRGLPPPPPKGPPSQNREDRVVRACKNCRKRKVKCSGDVPRCVVCQTNDLNCVYEQSRRDRLKEASDLNYVFLNLFKDISARLGDEDRKRIQDVIDVAEEDILEPSSTAVSVKSLGKRSRNRSASQSPDDTGPTKKHGEAHVTASVGSNEDLDYLDEDLMRSLDSRQTGYVGQNSEVQWLRSVQRQSRGEPMDLPYGPPGSTAHAIDERAKALHERRIYDNLAPTHPVTDATFYLDNDNIDLEVAVNAYELPDPDLAEQFLNCYMNAIHNSFPVVPLNFDAQARKFISAVRQNKAFRVPDRWRALLNLIFAIGARHSYLSGNQLQGTERDHLVFMTRASQLLGMNDHLALTSSPDLPLVQATAVFSLYFLIIGHVSRAWLTIGLSIRIAMALGLYLRNEVPEFDASRKETLERTWWSLHSIETLVSSITGRPPTISIEDTTVPLPRDSYSHKRQARSEQHLSDAMQEPPGDSPASRSPSSLDFLTTNLDIALLTQKALSGLYSPRTAARSWQDIQQSIKALLQELGDWSDRTFGQDTPLPGSAHAHQIERETMLLQMSYWSTRISITRPCLCRIERRIKNQSDSSAKFNSDMALSCVESARALTALFPDIPDPQFVYLKAPWWSVVHTIMQCAAVLLLEIGYQNQHTKHSNSDITSDLQKLVSWLRSIGQKDPCARRAYWVLQRISRDVAPHLRLRVDEALSRDAASKKIANLSNNFFASPTSQQNDNETWIQGHSFASPIADIDPQLSSPADQYSMLLSEFPTYDSIGAGGMPTLNGSGNPFINNWDEYMPFNVQNFWLQSRYPVANSSALSGDVRIRPWEDFPDQYQQQDPRPGSAADRGDGAGL